MVWNPGVCKILSVVMDAEEAMVEKYALVMAGTAVNQVKLTTGANVQCEGVIQNTVSVLELAAGGGKKKVDVMMIGITKVIRSASACARAAYAVAEGADGHVKAGSFTSTPGIQHVVGRMLSTPDTDGDWGYMLLNISDIYMPAS